MEPQIFRVVKSEAVLAGNKGKNIGEMDIERAVQGGFLEEVALQLRAERREKARV